MLRPKMFLKYFSILASIFIFSGCATITNDAYIPVALSFSDGSDGSCNLRNKRMSLEANIPGTPMIRRSDDALTYTCKTTDGREAFGSIASTIEAAKLAGSVVFFDLGITDAITDKHRLYPSNFVIPMSRNK